MVQCFVCSHSGSSAGHGLEEESLEVGRPVRKIV